MIPEDDEVEPPPAVDDDMVPIEPEPDDALARHLAPGRSGGVGG